MKTLTLKSSIFALAMVGLMSSCGFINKTLGIQQDKAAEIDGLSSSSSSSSSSSPAFAWDSPRPEPALIRSHVVSFLEAQAASIMSGDVRMRGQLIGSAEGAVVRVKLDLRLRLENQEPVVWMAISDPMMGLPVGRLKITADSVHGFSPVLKKYGAEPVSDLSKWGVGVTLTAGDLQQALMGLPMAMPTGACHVDQGADTWTLTFQSMRDNEVADITLVFERGIRPRLRSQQIDAGGETVLIAYALSSSLPSSMSSSTLPSLTAASSSMFTAWTLTVQGRGQLTFKLQHIDWDADLTFPYNLPSGYARMAL